ncbi:hypothetical protein CC86DRAFT_114207 [Ophiobolus disseminans]|uniref:DUF7820 domain-containing protein n=1 Tax=Ophiobolus disseminans TaxID=1469910 RepID=A0A6A6ZJU5_9PLEO|nr:hypothetical protein CC86DRAFT_114207 [Ophiobolus disseminans]
MRLPCKPVKNIQPLPNIHTVFNTRRSANNSTENSTRCSIIQIEDGIEVVPIERSNILSAPILSPDESDKEVMISRQGATFSEKPLPTLPKSFWAKLSLRQRILSIIGVQCATLLTIGLALSAVKPRLYPSEVTLPRGSFAILVEEHGSQEWGCLAKRNESLTWQCAANKYLQLDISAPTPGSNTTMVQLSSLPTFNGTIYYGQQSPDIQPVELSLFIGEERYNDPPIGLGPVNHFRATYNRTVLVKEEYFNPPSEGSGIPMNHMEHALVQQSDTLWRCNFNESTMEGYLYADQRTFATSEIRSMSILGRDLLEMKRKFKLSESWEPTGKSPYCERVKVQYGTLARVGNETKALTAADFADPCRCIWTVE